MIAFLLSLPLWQAIIVVWFACAMVNAAILGLCGLNISWRGFGMVCLLGPLATAGMVGAFIRGMFS